MPDYHAMSLLILLLVECCCSSGRVFAPVGVGGMWGSAGRTGQSCRWCPGTVLRKGCLGFLGEWPENHSPGCRNIIGWQASCRNIWCIHHNSTWSTRNGKGIQRGSHRSSNSKHYMFMFHDTFQHSTIFQKTRVHSLIVPILTRKPTVKSQRQKTHGEMYSINRTTFHTHNRGRPRFETWDLEDVPEVGVLGESWRSEVKRYTMMIRWILVCRIFFA